MEHQNKHTSVLQDPLLEFLGNSLTQTNQTKQKFIKLYYLDYSTFC